MEAFKEKVERLFQRHEELITRKNVAVEDGNGIFTRYKYPVVTAAHTPVFWRYDLDEKSNPYLMERIGMNAVYQVLADRMAPVHILPVSFKRISDYRQRKRYFPYRY